MFQKTSFIFTVLMIVKRIGRVHQYRGRCQISIYTKSHRDLRYCFKTVLLCNEFQHIDYCDILYTKIYWIEFYYFKILKIKSKNSFRLKGLTKILINSLGHLPPFVDLTNVWFLNVWKVSIPFSPTKSRITFFWWKANHFSSLICFSRLKNYMRRLFCSAKLG